MAIVFFITNTITATITAIIIIITIAIATIITTAITNIHRGQSLEIPLYGIDAWRETALYDGIEIIRRGNDTDIVVKFPAERVDFIATHF